MEAVMKRSTEILEACTDQLNELDIDYVIERGKHVKVRWTAFDGRQRICVLPFSSSDVNCVRAVRATTRRMLRQDGVLQ
jgi:hypothetical protein